MLLFQRILKQRELKVYNICGTCLQRYNMDGDSKMTEYTADTRESKNRANIKHLTEIQIR
jgi:hypothetical protein